MTWIVEEIPDTDVLYMRVDCGIIERNEVPAGVFRDRDGHGMSTDWCRYSTTHATRARGRKSASEYAVIALVAGKVKAIRPLQVTHTPDWPNRNRAHTDITGFASVRKFEQTAIREQLWDIAEMRIRCGEPVREALAS